MKKTTFTLKTLGLLAAFLLFLSTAFAQEPGDAWGYACGFTAGDPILGNMYEFDLNTGDETLVGPLCGGGTTILTGEFANGIYYGLNSGTSELITVDETGACQTVGVLSPNPSGTIGLSHDVNTGITYLVNSNNDLYTIDLNNATLTFIGNIAGAQSVISLAIGENSDAYILSVGGDFIAQIDLATAQIIPGTTFPLFDNNGLINLNFAQDADFDCDQATGLLFGMIYRGGGTGELGTINPSTGEFVSTAFIGTEICGFSVNTFPTPPPIPTMGQWALFLFGMVVFTLGVVVVWNLQNSRIEG